MLRAYCITLISYFLKPAKRKLLKFCLGAKKVKKASKIGGPSSFFLLKKDIFPIYAFANKNRWRKF